MQLGFLGTYSFGTIIFIFWMRKKEAGEAPHTQVHAAGQSDSKARFFVPGSLVLPISQPPCEII